MEDWDTQFWNKEFRLSCVRELHVVMSIQIVTLFSILWYIRVPVEEKETKAAIQAGEIRPLHNRNIYVTLVIDLVLTFGMLIMAAFFRDILHENEIMKFVRNNVWIPVTAGALTLGLCAILSVFERTRRMKPWNSLLFGVYVIISGIILMYATFAYSLQAIVVSSAGTLVTTALFAVIAKRCKRDWTRYHKLALFAVFLIVSFGFFRLWFMFLVSYQTSNVIKGQAGPVIFSLILAIHWQLAIGGRKFEIDPKDNVLTSLVLYLNAISIFLYSIINFGD